MDKLIEQFSFGLFFWQLLLFIGLAVLLWKFAWKPILNAVNDREDGIKDALEAAENAKKEMENLQADNERLLQEARVERDTLLKEARDIKTKMIDDAKTEAQEEASKLIENAQNAIESEKKAAIVELKSQVAALSIDIAEKVVRQELSNKDKQLEVVNNLVKEATL